MSAVAATAKRKAGCDTGIRHLFEELNREDSELRPHLLDAALAGLRLSRNPSSNSLRCDAAEVWDTIEPMISHHLQAEDDLMLSGVDRHAHISGDVLHRVRQCHRKLRKFMTAIETAGFETETDAEAADAGRALGALAVCLDDAIDAEQRKIFLAIQKAISPRSGCRGVRENEPITCE